MPSVLADFVSHLASARKDLGKITSPQLNSQRRRDSLRSLVEEYFNSIRPSVVRPEEQDPEVASVDDFMQELLVMCHKRGSVKQYQTLLSKARKVLIAVDARLVASPHANNTTLASGTIDNMITDTLDRIVPSAALSYRQALIDLQTDQRLSWRGPATDLREALRETLDHLAPDADVIASPGYKQAADTKGPTMKQKIRFIMKNRGVSKSQSTSAETAADSVEEAVGSFVRSVYVRSSVSTHTPTNKTEVIRVRDFVRVVLCELLEINT